MRQSQLHHCHITLVGEGVGVDLTLRRLRIIIATSISALWVGKVVGIVSSDHSLFSFKVVEGLRHGATLAARG